MKFKKKICSKAIITSRISYISSMSFDIFGEKMFHMALQKVKTKPSGNLFRPPNPLNNGEKVVFITGAKENPIKDDDTDDDETIQEEKQTQPELENQQKNDEEILLSTHEMQSNHEIPETLINQIQKICDNHSNQIQKSLQNMNEEITQKFSNQMHVLTEKIQDEILKLESIMIELKQATNTISTSAPSNIIVHKTTIETATKDQETPQKITTSEQPQATLNNNTNEKDETKISTTTTTTTTKKQNKKPRTSKPKKNHQIDFFFDLPSNV